MRILHIVHQYPPDHMGGTEYYTRSVAQALSRRGHSVAIFTRRSAHGAGNATRMDGNIPVHVTWNGFFTPTQRFLATFGNAGIAETFAALLDHFSPHLIHVQHLMGMPTSLLDEIRQRRIPFVITLHDFWWICANAQLITNYSNEICDGPNLWLNCARCALARGNRSTFWPAIPALAAMLAHRSNRLGQLMASAQRIIAPSRFVKDWHVQHGVAADKITVLKHGVDRCPGVFPHWMNTPNTSGRSLRLLYAGGISWQKGLHILIEAFAATPGAVELWIAGDEKFDPAYSQRLRRLAAQDPAERIRFLGRLSHSEVQARLAQTDAVVVPALWYESFSFLVHEAFAAGVPVIASDLGALAEAIQNARDGLLVPPGDLAAWQSLLQRISTHPDLLAGLRAHVRPPMTVAAHIDHLLAIYAAAAQLPLPEPEIALST